MSWSPFDDLVDSGATTRVTERRRKVRVRRNLPGRWVLVNYKLLSDTILPPGVGAVIDWVKPSITLLVVDRTTSADVDLDRVLHNVLRQCGMNPTTPVKSIWADSEPDGLEPDKLDPPRWCMRMVALLERLAIAMPLASDLTQIYRATRAKSGRRVALRVYCGQLFKGMSGGSVR